MIRWFSILIGLTVAVAMAAADNWPTWRGPTGQGHCFEKDLPVRWSRTENVRWKVPLPAAGNSTPVLWGDRVFITQASDYTVWPPRQVPDTGGSGNSRPLYAIAERRSVMCFNRADGKLLWQRDTIYKEKELTHGSNPFCSASPGTDGERVIAFHNSAGVVCYDFDGKELWKRDVGKLEHVWGTASSPILHGDLCILWCGPGERQALVALDKKTGAIVWEHQEPGGGSGHEGKGGIWGSWGSPVIGRVGSQDQVVAATRRLKGFDPKTGAELWAAGKPLNLCYHSPVYADGIAYLGSSADKHGGTGDISKDNLGVEIGTGRGPTTGVVAGGYAYAYSSANADGCGIVMIALNASGARCAQWRYVMPATECPRISMDDSGVLVVVRRAGLAKIFELPRLLLTSLDVRPRLYAAKSHNS